MNIGIVGLGLIGGSLAKAIKQMTDHRVFALDKDESVTTLAQSEGAIDDILEDTRLIDCDIIIVALYPSATIDFIQTKASLFKAGSIVTDCAGVKAMICDPLHEIAAKYKFTFIGAHPMAGIERTGYSNSKPDMFKNASMIMTPYAGTPSKPIEALSKLWLSLGFGKIVLSSPNEHDDMIAYTSQLAHIVSSAYVKSDRALNHKGFSAGSFQDLSRVAKLNEEMWTELFFDNKESLINELDGFIERIQKYREALNFADHAQMKQLLKDGRLLKELIDG